MTLLLFTENLLSARQSSVWAHVPDEIGAVYLIYFNLPKATQVVGVRHLEFLLLTMTILLLCTFHK